MQLAYWNPTQRRLLGAVALSALLLMLALIMKTGSPSRLVLVLALALLPALGYIAWSRPMIFPYGLYVLLIPFDNLLSVGRGGTATRLLGIAAGIAILIWCLRKGKAVNPGWPVAAIFALLVWSAATALWSVNQPLVLAALPTYCGLILLYCALAVFPTSVPEFRWLAIAAAAAGIVSALYGINAFMHDPSIASQNLIERRLVVRAGLNSIDPNEYADALLFPTAALLMFGLRANNMLRKLCHVPLLAAVAGAIILSGSREAAIGLGVIVLYYAWRSSYRIELAFLVGLLVFALGNVKSSLWLRFADAGSPRQSVWAVGFEAFKHRPLAGYGLGTFIDVYDNYYLKVHQVFTNGWSSPAHNVVVHFMVELGIVGIILMVFFVAAQLRGLRCIPRGDILYDYRVMMEASLLSVATAAMFIDLFNYKWAWMVFAMATQLRNAALSRTSPESSESLGKRLDDPTRAVGAIGAAEA